MRSVELYERIRRDRRQRKWGVRRLAREHHCHRRDVRQALASPRPPGRKERVFQRPTLGPHLAAIHAMFKEDQTAPRKQRHTAHRIWTRLTKEHNATVAESTVRAYVRAHRREIRGIDEEGMVPQAHVAGDEAEVDLYFADVDFPSGRENVCFFQMRACHSGVPFHRPMRRETQQAFLEAHGEAFQHYGGVFSVLRYDNLGSAVSKVLRGRTRLESERFTLLRSHYGFEAVFCLVGLQGAHEKGGVEGEVGYFRRNHLVPVPKVESWSALIELCRAGAEEEMERHLDGRAESIGESWATERERLLPLPGEPFDANLHLTPLVDCKARVSVLRNRYSAPTTLRGLRLNADVGSENVVLRHRGREVGRHQRLYGVGGDRLQLDHYLEVLRFKPRALAGSLPLRQEIESGSFPAAYVELLQKLRERVGESEGARQMVDVLFLHREHGAPTVLMAVERALAAGAYDFNAVALLARPPEAPRNSAGAGPRLHVLDDPDLPVPDCRHYDQLLTER